jgi:hypothetical protein
MLTDIELRGCEFILEFDARSPCWIAQFSKSGVNPMHWAPTERGNTADVAIRACLADAEQTYELITSRN